MCPRSCYIAADLPCTYGAEARRRRGQARACAFLARPGHRVPPDSKGDNFQRGTVRSVSLRSGIVQRARPGLYTFAHVCMRSGVLNPARARLKSVPARRRRGLSS